MHSVPVRTYTCILRPVYNFPLRGLSLKYVLLCLWSIFKYCTGGITLYCEWNIHRKVGKCPSLHCPQGESLDHKWNCSLPHCPFARLNDFLRYSHITPSSTSQLLETRGRNVEASFALLWASRYRISEHVSHPILVVKKDSLSFTIQTLMVQWYCSRPEDLGPAGLLGSAEEV